MSVKLGKLARYFGKLEFVNIILHFYMKSQYDLVQIILMQ